MPSLNTKLASAPNVSANYVLKATTSTTIGNSLIFDNGTQVGINTASPSYVLDVQANNATFVNRIINLNTSTDSAGLLVQAGVNAGNEIALFRNAAGTDRMAILANGYVGIGTSSPADLLEVKGGFIRLSATTGNGPQFNLYSNGQTTNHVTLAQGFALATDNIGYLFNRANAGFVFGTNNTERMRISSDGSIGFNISTLASRSFAFQGISGRPLVIEAIENAGVHSIMMRPNNSGYNLISSNYLSGGAYLPLSLSARENTSDFVLRNNGCIFVNTTAAAITSNMRLSVKQTLGEGAAEVWTSWAGDVSTAAFWVIKYDNVNSTSQIFQRFAINNGATACGQINANGASQVAFGSYSDIRLKENIVELEPQLDKILALKPCEFDYKDGSGHQIGFIAQEMQEVYPDVVNESLDGMLTLSGWNKTEARLVKAIQEQNQLISELRKELDSLKQLVK